LGDLVQFRYGEDEDSESSRKRKLKPLSGLSNKEFVVTGTAGGLMENVLKAGIIDDNPNWTKNTARLVDDRKLLREFFDGSV
jgi:hypothetical protein